MFSESGRDVSGSVPLFAARLHGIFDVAGSLTIAEHTDFPAGCPDPADWRLFGTTAGTRDRRRMNCGISASVQGFLMQIRGF